MQWRAVHDPDGKWATWYVLDEDDKVVVSLYSPRYYGEDELAKIGETARLIARAPQMRDLLTKIEAATRDGETPPMEALGTIALYAQAGLR